MERDKNISIETDREGERDPTWGEDGVDPTLIRWMLSLSPAERLQVLQDTISSIERMGNAKFRNRNNRERPNANGNTGTNVDGNKETRSLNG